VTVTPEGAAYRERALRLLGELDEMDATVSEGRAVPRGRLRVDIGSSLANLILIPALPAFQALYPEIELFLGVSDRAADIVGDGIDCVIRGGRLDDTTLLARRLCELDYVTCAAPAYLAAKGTPETPADLDRHRIVSYFSALSGRSFPLRFSKDSESLEINGLTSVAVNESTAHLNALVSGLGIGQTFGFMARPHLENGGLQQILQQWTQTPHTLHLVYPANRYQSLKLKAFSDWAVELFKAYDIRRG
jgi:DNA-binding transcriptional LysR family regulator